MGKSDQVEIIECLPLQRYTEILQIDFQAVIGFHFFFLLLYMAMRGVTILQNHGQLIPLPIFCAGFYYITNNLQSVLQRLTTQMITVLTLFTYILKLNQILLLILFRKKHCAEEEIF